MCAGTSLAAELRSHAAGHDCADAHILVAMVHHERFGKAQKAELGRVICASACKGVAAGQAANINDETPAAASKPRQGFLATVKGSTQVSFQGACPILGLQIRYGLEDADAGIVDENVNASEILIDKSKQSYNLISQGYIGR